MTGRVARWSSDRNELATAILTLSNLWDEPSGRLPVSENFERSISDTFSSLRTIAIFGPLAVMVMWFHSPAGFWAFLVGATRS